MKTPKPKNTGKPENLFNKLYAWLAGLLGLSASGVTWFIMAHAKSSPLTEMLVGTVASGMAAFLASVLFMKQVSEGSSHEHSEVMPELYHSTIRCLAAAIDARDHYGNQHVTVVESTARKIAHEMGLKRDEIEGIRTAALLLGIGTLGVPENILLQPGSPTSEEFVTIHNHPIIGAQILDNVNFPWPVQKIIRSHHERWNGAGYPDRLRGEEIPIGARILAVADVYGALTSNRTYRCGWSHQQAVDYIKSVSGVLFDPVVVRAFEQIEHTLSENNAGVETSSSGQASATIARANQQFVALWEISRSANTSLDLKCTVDTVNKKIADAVPCDACAIFLADSSGVKLTCAADWPVSRPGLQGLHAVIGDPGTGHVAADKRPSIIRPSQDFLRLPNGSSAHLDFDWAAIAPLRVGNTILGTVNVYRRERDFSIEELDLLDTLARHASVPVSNATLYEATRQIAERDPLTGLYNLRHFYSTMENEVARAKRRGRHCSIIAIDLNRFKVINDTMGHPAGDALLRDLARLFVNTVREYDTVVRYGGDEFVVVLPEASEQNAQETIERLQAAVDDYISGLVGLRASGFGVSFGAATFPQDGRSVKTLLATADSRMYENKHAARSTLRAA